MTICDNCGHEDPGEFLFCPRCGSKAPEGGGVATLIGRTLNDKYRVVAEIGAGAMGTVYLGEHLGLKKKVALKVLHPDLQVSDESLRRFQREGIAAGKFSHPNAIQIFDFDKDGGRICYLAMEYVEGSNLRVYLRREGRLSIPLAKRIARSILSCLAEAHRQGIIHRDLKPDNIMVAPGSGGEIRIKVLDFGLSKLVDRPADSSLVTQQGRILGTPLYMAPEQCSGEEADARSDIYAVGLMLYEMVAGIRPFPEESTSELLFSRATKEAPSLLGEFPDLAIPPELDAVLVKAMQRRREDRYQTAQEMMAAMESVPAEISRFGPATTSLMTSVAQLEQLRADRPAGAGIPAPAPAVTAVPGAAPAVSSGGTKKVPLLIAGLVLLAAAAWFGRGLLPAGIHLGTPPARVRLLAADDRTPEQEKYVRDLDAVRSMLAGGQNARAFQILGDALRSPALDPEANFLSGEFFRAQGNLENALADYEIALEGDADYLEPALAIARIHMDREDWETAGVSLTRALEIAPEDADLSAMLAIVDYRRGELQKSYERLRSLVEEHPSAREAQLFLGRLYLDGGDPVRAVQALERARRDDATDPRAARWLGEAYLASDAPSKAEGAFTDALALRDDPELRWQVAALRLDAGQVLAAEELLDESLVDHPEEARLHVLRAAAAVESGDMRQASRSVEEAMRRGANDVEVRSLAALLLHADDRLEEASKAYRELLDDYPGLPSANLGMGLVLVTREEFEEAANCFQRSIDFGGPNSIAYFHLGRLYMDYLGDRVRARENFEAYLEEGGTDPQVGTWLKRL